MSAGVHLPLSVAEFKAKAREITGIDIEDRDADEPLTVLTNSYNNDANLHAAGAEAVTSYLLRIMCNRLRMQRDFINHPEIADQEIKTPVFLWGMPRTGSTKMQKLLAASGDFNWLTFWQSFNPALFTGDPGESTQPRIADTDKFADWFATTSPDTTYIHPLKTHEPEEETFILMHSLRTPNFMAFTDMGSYLRWLTTQDMSAPFKYLKDSLKYLQWQGLATGSKPWVLKSPVSYGLENPVLSVFPDAKLVMTHRDISETMASFCSTVKSYFAPFSDSPINYLTGVNQLTWALNNHLRAREDTDRIKILDIGYRELVRSAGGVIDKIYAFCDFPLTPGSRAAMLKWDETNPKEGKPPHKYTLAEFGLSDEFINENFANYTKKFQSILN
jgi:hypothetical protein